MPTTKPKTRFINPLEVLKEATLKTRETATAPTSDSMFKEIPKVGENATQVDFNKLTEAYDSQDKKAIQDLQKDMPGDLKKEAFKLQYFKKYKQEEEEYYLKRKQEEEEKKQQEEYEEQQKIKMEEEAKLAAHAGNTEPKGKRKKSIMGKMKDIASTVLPPEMKPGHGKQ